MREIKFRYYDSKNKIMWKVRSVDFSNRGFVQLESESDGKDFVYDCLRCGEEFKCYSPFKIIEISELMQYTGLKDKNGKEIYEGDILGTPDIVNVTVYWFEQGGRWNGKYHGKSKDCEINDTVSYASKVIGNIYENPKLLKGDTNDKE